MGDSLAPKGSLVPFREAAYGWRVLAVVWLVCAIYTGGCLKQAWFPYDAGSLAQMAERVLLRQVPHRDFGDMYTGGLTYLDALAFRLFGTNFFSLRIPLFLFFLGWVPAVYFIARRFVSPLGAGAATLLAVAWSVPNYPEGMPSWYNLFFATWGMLALIRYAETDEQRWLWTGGLCGGLSFLVKITGLYFVAAGLLFLVFREQSFARGKLAAPHKGNKLYKVFVVACLVAFLAAIIQMLSRRPNPRDLFNFAFPSACLVALLLWQEWRVPLAPSVARIRSMLRMLLPFLGGLLAPVAVFLTWYAREGALWDWFEGTFVLPVTRIHWVAQNPPSPLTAIGLGLLAAVLLIAYYGREVFGRFARPVVIAALAGALVEAHRSTAVYEMLSLSLPMLVPLLAVGLLVRFWNTRWLPDSKRQQVFLAVATAVVCALIQFPFAGLIYFSYVIPLVALAIVALLSTLKKTDRVSLTALGMFYLVFALWLHTPAFLVTMRLPPNQPYHLRPMALSREGGIRVRLDDATKYEQLVQLIRAHARGTYIYATVDCPEVYFLSGYRNPTGTLFDFLDRDFLDPVGRAQRILNTLKNRGVDLVVLRGDPDSFGPMPAALRTALDAQFPRSQTVGNFEVRWK